MSTPSLHGFRSAMDEAIDTPRLALRLFTDADTTQLHEIFSDPETHTIGEGPLTNPAQTREWIERRIATRAATGLCWYAIREHDTGLLLGNCGIFPGRTGNAEPEIGYEIRRSHQGHGFAREAAAAVLAEALHTGIPRIWATIRPHNIASLRVATSIGLRHHSLRADTKGPLTYLVSHPD
ncbi:GNAT family N-acetyltransferase [Nocardia sp. NPDC101769]|uniref:GNAT family N-acetyltransferase n=1 Tax=Nocardia sp. NPDC101769 TaxID=3364333 RepID=UPI0037FC135F